MLDTARALAERTALASSAEKACVEAVGVLAQAGDDLPFGLIYLFEHVTGTARLAGSWGEVPDVLGMPPAVPLSKLDAGKWPAKAAARRVRVMPFTSPGSVKSDGALIAGVGPDGDHHRSIVELLAAQLGGAVAAARARSTERLRVTAPNALRELADASHALATSLNAPEICRVVLDLVLPDHGLWCAVWLVRSDDLGNDHVDVRHDGAFPEHAALLRQVFQGTGTDVRGPLGVDECLRSARVVARPVTSDHWPDDIQTIGGATAVTVPMRARGRIVGAITFGRTEHAITEMADLKYLEELAKRAALAFDNAAMYAAEQRIALGLQRSLLPHELPEINGLRLATRYLPGARGTRVGGDWYDTIALPDGRIGLSIGDVVGHGVRAAARMGQLRTALRSYAVRGQQPAQVLKELDAYLLTSGESRFATCLYAVFDVRTGTLRIANAGHLQPLLLVPGRAPRFVQAGTGVPLGGASRLVSKGPAFSTRTVRMPAKAALVLYTDGLVEYKNRMLDNGLDLLSTALRGTFASAEEICDRALAAMEIDGDTKDDTTLLVLQRI